MGATSMLAKGLAGMAEVGVPALMESRRDRLEMQWKNHLEALRQQERSEDRDYQVGRDTITDAREKARDEAAAADRLRDDEYRASQLKIQGETGASARAASEAQRRLAEYELGRKQQLDKLRDQLATTTDEEERNRIQGRINDLTGAQPEKPQVRVLTRETPDGGKTQEIWSIDNKGNARLASNPEAGVVDKKTYEKMVKDAKENFGIDLSNDLTFWELYMAKNEGGMAGHIRSAQEALSKRAGNQENQSSSGNSNPTPSNQGIIAQAQSALSSLFGSDEQDAQTADSLRTDGTPKGNGFFGPLELPNGKIATEYSIESEDVMQNGKPVPFPSLVPTLTAEELDLMVNDIIPNDKTPPDSVTEKAIAHARMRIANGMSPFAGEDEVAKPLEKTPEDATAAEGGIFSLVETGANAEPQLALAQAERLSKEFPGKPLIPYAAERLRRAFSKLSEEEQARAQALLQMGGGGGD